jgi:Putative zinc-finger
MTCEEVRELLPEHLLGTLEEPEDLEVRRHLRGCTGCREERMHLEEGVSALSRAVHDHEPPPELRERVLRTLDEEWEETGRVPATPVASRGGGRERSPWRALAAAAVFIALVASAVFGVTQTHKASVATADAQSYQNLLASLGGLDFRIGKLHPTEGSTMHGQVLIYDGDPSGDWQSWAIVFAKAPGYTGSADATLLAPDGTSRELPPIDFEEGDGHTWQVTYSDLARFDSVRITSPSGDVLATATIEHA